MLFMKRLLILLNHYVLNDLFLKPYLNVYTLAVYTHLYTIEICIPIYKCRPLLQQER